MQSFITFVNAILIASSVLSSVWTLPTESIGATLGIDDPSPEKSSICIETYPYPHNREVRNFREHTVDSEGQSCIPTRRQPFVGKLLNDSDFDNNYANLTAEVCPALPQTTQCIRNHLNSIKCNEEMRKLVIDSKIVNSEIVMFELLCNPLWAQHFRNMWKKMLKEKLWECFFDDNNLELSGQCETEFEGAGQQRRYQDLGIFFECMKPGLRKCANGDLVREVELVRVWEEFDRALHDAHRAFWNY